MVQLILNLTEHVSGKGLMQHVFILHACKHACACTIDDIKPIVQSSRVYTRHVNNTT